MTGKITVNNQTYFLNSDGTLVTSDWYKYDNSWYYLDENGLPKTGWLQLDSKWYYLKEDGTMATGELIIDNKNIPLTKMEYGMANPLLLRQRAPVQWLHSPLMMVLVSIPNVF